MPHPRHACVVQCGKQDSHPYGHGPRAGAQMSGIIFSLRTGCVLWWRGHCLFHTHTLLQQRKGGEDSVSDSECVYFRWRYVHSYVGRREEKRKKHKKDKKRKSKRHSSQVRLPPRGRPSLTHPSRAAATKSSPKKSASCATSCWPSPLPRTSRHALHVMAMHHKYPISLRCRCAARLASLEAA